MRRDSLLLGFMLAAVMGGTVIAQRSIVQQPKQQAQPVARLFSATPSANVCMVVPGDRAYYVETAYENGWLAVKYLDHQGADISSSGFLNLAQIKLFQIGVAEECSRLH